jgi:uncharacterized protein (DUF58 family)
VHPELEIGTLSEMATQLLTPELIAALHGLELRARTVVDSALAGQHRSRRKGFSTQFAEHREYSPGDDLRYIDWKLFGKRDRYYIKQFEDETRLRAWLVVDNSRSMHYRSAQAALAKLEYAAVLATSIAWLILKQRDEVGVSLVGDTVTSLGVQGHPAHLKQIIAFLEQELTHVPDRFLLSNQIQSHAQPANAPLLHDLAERIPVRSLVVWITDGFLDSTEIRELLRHWKHRQHDVRMIHLVDPAEADFPFDEPTLFRGLEGGADQMITPRSIRSAYLAEWTEFLRETESCVRQLECDYLYVRTDAAFDAVLHRWLTG